MSTYVRPRSRRPEVRFVQDPTLYVQQATVIPDGMHGLGEKRIDTDAIIRSLIARGVRPERAHALVQNALHRLRQRWHGNRGLHLGQLRRRGMGDGEEDAALLASVQARGADVQRQHADLIAKIPSGEASGDKLRIRNLIDQLYADWTAYAVGVKNGAAPYQWNRTDPVDAILIAIRDDLRNTVELLDANKAQQVLAKQIAELPKPRGGTYGNPLGIRFDLPWYVYAGGAAGVAAVLGKAFRLW